MSGSLWFCFSISGATGLALEVLWMRSAGFVLGTTAPTAATVLACYFAGLGLGAASARGHQQRSVRHDGMTAARLQAEVRDLVPEVILAAESDDPGADTATARQALRGLRAEQEQVRQRLEAMEQRLKAITSSPGGQQ